MILPNWLLDCWNRPFNASARCPTSGIPAVKATGFPWAVGPILGLCLAVNAFCAFQWWARCGKENLEKQENKMAWADAVWSWSLHNLFQFHPIFYRLEQKVQTLFATLALWPSLRMGFTMSAGSVGRSLTQEFTAHLMPSSQTGRSASSTIHPSPPFTGNLNAPTVAKRSVQWWFRKRNFHEISGSFEKGLN